MNLRESINKSLRLQELYKSMMYHLQHDAAPEPEKEKFGAAELEKMYGSKSSPKFTSYSDFKKFDKAHSGAPMDAIHPDNVYKGPKEPVDHVTLIHNHLLSKGFKHFQDNGYSFYKKDDHIISVNQSNGQWIKSTKGKGRTIGSGHGDLVRYFKQYGNR